MSKLFVSMVALAVSGVANAASFSDYADVVSATPVMQKFNEPKRECWFEEVSSTESVGGSNAGAVIGGLAGGILGNQVGKGSGKSVATALGAITGAIVGNNLQGKNAQAETVTTTQQVQKCRLVDNFTQRVTGYQVTWRYAGRDFVSHMAHQPGSTVRVFFNGEISE